MFVLAVDIDQQFTKRFQIALRARRSVDIAARTPFGGDYAAQNARAIVVQVSLGQPGSRIWNVIQVEAGKDVCLVRANTHHAAISTVAQSEAQSVQHDRLTSAGFTADHAHAAFQLKIEMLDDRVIVNGKMDQHGRTPA